MKPKSRTSGSSLHGLKKQRLQAQIDHLEARSRLLRFQTSECSFETQQRISSIISENVRLTFALGAETKKRKAAESDNDRLTAENARLNAMLGEETKKRKAAESDNDRLTAENARLNAMLGEEAKRRKEAEEVTKGRNHNR